MPRCQTPVIAGHTVKKAEPLSKIGGDSLKAFDYAIGSIYAAQSKCPSTACEYADVAWVAKKDYDGIVLRGSGYYAAMIQQVDQKCRAESARRRKPPEPATTAGRVVAPEPKPAVIPPLPPPKTSIWPFLLGGLALYFVAKG